MWFLDGDPVNRNYQKLKQKFGDTQYLLVGVSSETAPNVINSDTIQSIHDLHEFLLDNEHIANVNSLANFQFITGENDVLEIQDLFDSDTPEYQHVSNETDANRIETILLDQPIVLDDIITRDMKHTILLAETFYQNDGRVDHHVELVNAVKEFVDVQHYADKGINIELFGRPYISHQLTSGNIKDQMIMYPLLLLATIVLLALVFRKVRPTILPWFVIVLCVFVAYTIQGLMEWPTTVANASMPFLVVIIGIGMSVHVMVDHYRRLAVGNTGKLAAKQSIQHLFKPAFFTTLTTVFGFVGLSITRDG